MCPVDETGANSVSPSTIPKMMPLLIQVKHTFTHFLISINLLLVLKIPYYHSIENHIDGVYNSNTRPKSYKCIKL